MLVVDSSTGTKNNESERDKGSRDRSHEILIEVYKHYQQLAINEDRLFNERLMVFLTSHSILFLGFVMCFQVQYVLFHIVGIFLSFVGIALCVFGYILVNPAWKAWVEWQKELKKIETELKKELKEEWEVDLVFPFEFPELSAKPVSQNLWQNFEYLHPVNRQLNRCVNVPGSG